MEKREREDKALPLGWKKIEGKEDYYLNESTMDIAWDLEEVFQICKEENIEQDGLLHEEVISGLDFDDETNIDNLLNDDSDKNDHEDGKESSILNADYTEILHDKDHQGAPNVWLADSPISCAPADTNEDIQPSGSEAPMPSFDPSLPPPTHLPPMQTQQIRRTPDVEEGEESMDWEDINVENLLKVSKSVRSNTTVEIIEQENASSNTSDDNIEGEIVVVDTNIFLSA